MKSLFVMLFVFILFAVTGAQIPKLINYQGYLTAGGPVVHGEYSITFSIYGGISIDPLWSETHTVTLDSGFNAVSLGSLTPLTSDILSRPNISLGIKVGDDPEMTPRKRLVSVPYALMSKGVWGEENVFLSEGNVGIGMNNPGVPLQVVGTIHSTAGGFKFPDWTTQTTAAGGGGDDRATSGGGSEIERKASGIKKVTFAQTRANSPCEERYTEEEIRNMTSSCIHFPGTFKVPGNGPYLTSIIFRFSIYFPATS